MSDTLTTEQVEELLALAGAATQVEPRDLMAYDHGGGRLAVIRDGKRDLIADFYGDGADRDYYAALCPQTVSSLATELLALRKRVDELEGALKPSAATKAAYIGEFTIAVERIVNEDEEPVDDGADAPDPYDHIQVPWTTIKQIMAAIRAYALPTPKEPS